MKQLLVILGPTATGKTDLAIKLAKIFNGELVACDSRQVYKGLNIGTGKMPGNQRKAERGKREEVKVYKSKRFWEISEIKIWMYDVVELGMQYSVFDYIKDAIRVIGDIRERGKLPIIVGGTGLYLKGLLEGFDKMDIPVDLNLRKELQKLTLEELQSRVATLSPITWQNMNYSDRNNPRRLIRKIEQIHMYPYINQKPEVGYQLSDFDILKIGLVAPRPYLFDQINHRVFSWIDSGIIAEVKKLLKSGVTIERFKDLGLEYKVIADFLEGNIDSKDELIKKMQSVTRQYAKRQETWFKKEKDVHWYGITEPDWAHRVETEVRNWYNS